MQPQERGGSSWGRGSFLSLRHSPSPCRQEGGRGRRMLLVLANRQGRRRMLQQDERTAVNRGGRGVSGRGGEGRWRSAGRGAAASQSRIPPRRRQQLQDRCRLVVAAQPPLGRLQQPRSPPPTPAFPGELQQVKTGPVTRQVACAGPEQKQPGKPAQRRAEGPWGGVYVEQKEEELSQE